MPRGPARGRRETNWGPRLLAPAAFLAAATVAVLLIRAGMEPNGGSTSTQPPPTTRSTRTSTRPTTTQRRPPIRRTYVIREGDTFETIAFEQGTTVEQLQALNPDVDPNSLQVGQRILVPR
jgi:LysM repeat protein